MAAVAAEESDRLADDGDAFCRQHHALELDDSALGDDATHSLLVFSPPEAQRQQLWPGGAPLSPEEAHQRPGGGGAAAAEEASALWAPAVRAQRYVWSSGTCCVMVAAFIFSLSALAVKLTGGRVPVLQITLIRSALSFVVSAGIIRARGIRPMFGGRERTAWLVSRGVTGALAMSLFYGAILLLPLADSMTLFFLNPAMTAVAAWAIRGEALGLLGAAGCLLSLAGMVLLMHPPMIFGGHADWGPRRVYGTALGVASALCATGAFISIRFIGKSEPAIVVALWFHTCTMALSSAPLALGWPQRPAPLSPLDAALLSCVAATSFGGQLFLTRGFQLENASKASGLNFSQVVYSYVFGLLVFREPLSLFGVAGTCLIALGMACVTARAGPVQPSDKSDAARDAAAAGAGSRVFALGGTLRSSASLRKLLGLGALAQRGDGADADGASLLDGADTAAARDSELGDAAGGPAGRRGPPPPPPEAPRRQGGSSGARGAGDAELAAAGPGVLHRHPATVPTVAAAQQHRGSADGATHQAQPQAPAVVLSCEQHQHQQQQPQRLNPLG